MKVSAPNAYSYSLESEIPDLSASKQILQDREWYCHSRKDTK